MRRVLLTFLLMLAACGGDSDDGAGPAGGGRAQALASFEAPTLDGASLRSADLAGKDLVLWFWAPW